MSIGNRMRGLGESVYYLDDLKPKMDELMGDVSYELNHEVGKRKLLVRLDGFGEEYKPQIETLMDEELPVGYRMEYDPFPLDYIRAEFLEGNNNIVKTWYVPTSSTGMRVDGYYRTYTTAGPIMGHYTKSSLRACIPYPRWAKSIFWFRGTSTGQATVDDELNIRHIIALNYFNSKQAQWGENVFSSPIIGEGFTDVITIGGYGGNPSNYVLYSAQITEGAELKRNFIPALDREGKPCVFDLVTHESFYSYTSGQFIAGLTMKQALNLAKLPVPSDNNKLTISLPKEARLIQHNSEVETALNDAATKGWNIAVQYRDAGEEGEVYKKYDKCTTVDDIVAVNADYKNDLTDEGEWIYPLTNIKRFTNVGDWWNGFFSNSSIKKIKAVFPNTVYAQALFSSADKLEEIDVEFPIATQISGFIRNNIVLKKLRIVAPFVTNSEYSFQWTYAKNPDIYIYFPMANRLDGMFANSPYFQEIKGEFGANATNCNSTYYKCNSLRICPSYYPKATTASDMFYGCQITAEVAINVLESFPKYTSGDHPVTMGIHIDHKDDIEVAEAIENAEAKGWTVTVQWNGTPTAQTASTFSLRKQPIYAKLGTMELPDNTTENYLDWGHYVTDWEKNGYMEFSSIEEAEEYFNIKTEIVE